MKLVLAIINKSDAETTIKNLVKEGFSVTKLATTGGFLQAGNVTVLIGLDEEKLEGCLEILKKYSHSRKEMLPVTSNLGMMYHPSIPIEITVGGATVFVMDVERFEKI